ncbi:MAG TPA: PspC domain-containing protein [Roseiflexaceae bacterium]|nr:PspC domain-containing protein [Roseiflexaceae bacterium]HMP40874.1 PspC domain-containing protein [Roseiflexaceae bacterium]
MQMPVSRLERSRSERIIAGVAGGVARYFMVDPVLVRLGFVALIFTGVGVILYPVLWILMPLEGQRSGFGIAAGGQQQAADGEEIPIQNIGSGRQSATDISERNRRLGQILVAVGLLILLNIVLGPMMGRLVFPIILIGAGLWMLRQRM